MEAPTAHRTSSSSCSGVPHGLFMISHHRPYGRWCFARLIRQAETLELQLHSQPPSKRTALSPPKRSCFRFASLALRLRTEPALRAAPVFRSAFFRKGHAMAFPLKRSTFRFASLTLRWAGEASLPPCCAPSRLAARWCSGRLIGCAKRSTSRFASLTLRLRTEMLLRNIPVFRSAFFRKGHAMAFSSKRSTFRFASFTLRWAGEASLPPAPLSPAPGNAETDRRQSPSAGKALFRSTPWISLPLCISPGGLPLPAHAAPTGGKTCSIHSRRNTLAAPGLFLLSYRSFFFSYFS